MNIYELSEEKDDLQADVNYYKREKERLEVKTGVKATDITKEIVSGLSGNSREDALLELAQTSIYLDEAISKLDNIIKLTNDKYQNFKKYSDYDKQIYTEKKLYKWSNAKISTKHHGIGKSQIYRIIEKIEDKYAKREKKGNIML